MAELRDIYDIDRQLTGRTAIRGINSEGELYLIVHVCIFNSKGQMLIQQRQNCKSWAGYWDVSVGGCAVAGETSRDAAHRELLEEIGLDVDFTGRRPHFTHNFEKGFDDFYLLNMEPRLADLRLQPEEVSAVRWAGADEILAMIDGGKFIPYFKSVVQMMFDVRHKLDCFNL